jgi:hypothetical protein
MALSSAIHESKLMSIPAPSSQLGSVGHHLRT